ncbi:CapA family protein [Paenibacillus sp. YAF4_2]|uniref:CapA family protein n=1 Tax=Paenibacillus sp. YAF4_2 TaxID=3233085 RepID=UPI003F9EA815
MSTEITITAVGDFLMKTRIINSCKGEKGYSFDHLFEPIAPYLRNADLTIGNLETVFAGKTSDDAYSVVKRHPRTNWPMFNCPDAFADTLKNLGFDFVSTANNHCMDNGISGLKRTLRILDNKGIAHTGTYRTPNEAQHAVIKEVKGIKIGFLAYTKTTNKIPVPSDHKWAVDLINPTKMVSDLKRLKAKNVDLIIVSLHMGREYANYPVQKQKDMVRLLFKHGADIILGAHSHTIQPAVFYKSGSGIQKFAIYSLGNIISTRLYYNDHTLTGLITQLQVRKLDDGSIRIKKVDFIPTWTRISKSGGRSAFKVVPLSQHLKKLDAGNPEAIRMKRMLQHVKHHIVSDPSSVSAEII